MFKKGIKNVYTNNKIVGKTKQDYGTVAAHELGHILGLADAYYDYGYDRCADNTETGHKYGKRLYDNLMKHHIYYKKLKANDVEMMLKAYEESSKYVSQYYKTYGDYTISEVINNKNDKQEDTE